MMAMSLFKFQYWCLGVHGPAVFIIRPGTDLPDI